MIHRWSELCSYHQWLSHCPILNNEHTHPFNGQFLFNPHSLPLSHAIVIGNSNQSNVPIWKKRKIWKFLLWHWSQFYVSSFVTIATVILRRSMEVWPAEVNDEESDGTFPPQAWVPLLPSFPPPNIPNFH